MNKKATQPSAARQPEAASAYDVVVNDLRSRLTSGMTDEARAVVEQALAALEKVSRPGAGTLSIGDPRPGSPEEVEAEIALEKLDP